MIPRKLALAGALESGTYTPTLTNTTNVAASTATLCQYLRVKDVVHVSGRVAIDPTAGSTGTTLGISLPIASSFTQAYDLAGVGTSNNDVNRTAAIFADTTNDRATLDFIAGADHSNQITYFTFTYRIIR